MDDISGKAPLLTLVHTTLPIISIILGLILMVVGFLLGVATRHLDEQARRARRTTASTAEHA